MEETKKLSNYILEQMEMVDYRIKDTPNLDNLDENIWSLLILSVFDFLMAENMEENDMGKRFIKIEDKMEQGTYQIIFFYHDLKGRKKKENKKLRKHVLMEQVKESKGELFFDKKRLGKFYIHWKC